MLVRKVAINEEQLRALLEGLFEEDLHAKRVLSLAHATLGVVHAASLSVHADRGFADQRLYALLAQAGFEYVVRFRKDVRVEVAGGSQQPAAGWMPTSGHAKKLTDVRVTADRTPVPAVVLVHQKGMKEPWCLATSLDTANARQVVDLYSRRFSCEETFRDVKDLRFGMGLSAVRVKSPERRDWLLLVSALAQVLLTLLGAAGESLGMEKGLKANTVKTRTYSLFRQGCMYYQAIPMMKEERLLPLIERFSEFLHRHPVFQEALGFISGDASGHRLHLRRGGEAGAGAIHARRARPGGLHLACVHGPAAGAAHRAAQAGVRAVCEWRSGRRALGTAQVRNGMMSTPSPGKMVMCGWSRKRRAASSAVSAWTMT